MSSVVIIQTNRKLAIYFEGRLYGLGSQIHPSEWIQLGILMGMKGFDMEDILNVEIRKEDLSSFKVLDGFPETLAELNEEVRAYLN